MNGIGKDSHKQQKESAFPSFAHFPFSRLQIFNRSLPQTKLLLLSPNKINVQKQNGKWYDLSNAKQTQKYANFLLRIAHETLQESIFSIFVLDEFNFTKKKLHSHAILNRNHSTFMHLVLFTFACISSVI